MLKAKEIIRKSIQDDANAFRAALIEQAEMHDDYARSATDKRAAQGAKASFNACLRAYDWIGRDDLSDGERAACIVAECGPMVIALNAAGKLQGLVRPVLTAAAVDWESGECLTAPPETGHDGGDAPVQDQERGAWIGWKADRHGYEVTVYDAESQPIETYYAGNDPYESSGFIPLDSERPRVPLGTLKRYAKQTAQEMARERGIALAMIVDETGE